MGHHQSNPQSLLNTCFCPVILPSCNVPQGALDQPHQLTGAFCLYAVVGTRVAKPDSNTELSHVLTWSCSLAGLRKSGVLVKRLSGRLQKGGPKAGQIR